MFQKMFYNTVLLNLLIVVVNAYSFTEITDTCSLPIKVGDCEAAIPRYGYNVTSKQCEQFSYGGCHGNPNNFANITACQTTCMDVCSLPQVVGSCKAYMPRYFFNKASGKCEEFIYGGCCGNANNFETLKDCQLVCKSHGTDMCCLPKDVGPCRAAVTRYFYNSRKRKCEKFTYGGCKGNANNFKCLDTCQKACQ